MSDISSASVASSSADPNTRAIQLSIADVYYTVTLHLPTLAASFEATYWPSDSETLQSPDEEPLTIASGSGSLADGQTCILKFDHSPTSSRAASPEQTIAAPRRSVPNVRDVTGQVALSITDVEDGRSAHTSVRVAYDVKVRGEQYEDSVELFAY